MIRTLLAAALAACIATPVLAADVYPNRPVKMVVNYPAGGAADVIARIYSDGLSRHLGQPVVVENRAGGTGSVGVETVVRSPADGYTLLAGPNGPIVLLPALRDTRYTAADLSPVGPMGEFVYALGVLPKTGIRTLAELIEKARASPGKYSYSSVGPGSAMNLRMEALKQMTGVDIVHVPYRTGAETILDFLAGTLDVMVDNLMFPQARAGQVILLAVTSERRFPDFPDVPTMTEAGYPIDLIGLSAVYVPKATPEPIRQRLSDAMQLVNAEPETQAKVLKIGFFPMNKTGKEMAAQLESSAEAYRMWVKKTGLKIE
jgi:tripartite-type tricarboxylate transporter receptor subunit TctC